MVENGWRRSIGWGSIMGRRLESITKNYAIFGIPRSMLFSEDGKVISNDAPRPSNEETRELFDKYLTGI